MYRLLFVLLWLSISGRAQSVSQRFFQQHQSALRQQFGRVASGPELQFLLGYILDRQHTDVEPNGYFNPRPAPLAALLAQYRGGASSAALAHSVVYPLLRFVLPQATHGPTLRPDAPSGERMAAAAHCYLGIRYGAPTYNPTTDRGTLDCSGLVNRVLTDVGLPYRRGAGTGATESIVNSGNFRPVSGVPRPGDLLARQHGGHWRHIGIYVGDGYLIEAPYRGTVVRRVAYQPDKWLRVLRYSGAAL